MNSTQIPNERTQLLKDYYSYATDKSHIFMMTELLEKVANEIYFPDIINIKVTYTDTMLKLSVSYIGYLGDGIHAQHDKEALKGFHSRIQVSYDWDNQVFVLQVFVTNTQVIRKEGNIKEIGNMLREVGQYEYRDLPIYTYGKWIADRLKEEHGFNITWF